jgi:hypothetical protein
MWILHKSTSHNASLKNDIDTGVITSISGGISRRSVKATYRTNTHYVVNIGIKNMTVKRLQSVSKENINFVEEQSNWPSAFKDKD